MGGGGIAARRAANDPEHREGVARRGLRREEGTLGVLTRRLVGGEGLGEGRERAGGGAGRVAGSKRKAGRGAESGGGQGSTVVFTPQRKL